MSMNEVKVFSSIYLDRLYRDVVATGDYSAFVKDKFQFEEIYPKGYSGIFIPADFKLDPEMDDITNSITLYEALRGISEIQASDERLWAYFIFNLSWEYMRKRWPVEKSDNPVGRIKDRYFLRTSKLESLTRNAIARLWWYAHLTYDENRSDKYELTRVLMKRADLTVGITERALGCSRNIRTGLLEFLQENSSILENEKLSRKLIKDLRLIGGVKNLPFLNKDDVKRELHKVI